MVQKNSQIYVYKVVVLYYRQCVCVCAPRVENPIIRVRWEKEQREKKHYSTMIVYVYTYII